MIQQDEEKKWSCVTASTGTFKTVGGRHITEWGLYRPRQEENSIDKNEDKDQEGSPCNASIFVSFSAVSTILSCECIVKYFMAALHLANKGGHL
mmetsp:Transcript_14367/g.23316  ORF Transcript_14367/g.23316 Transcript_14367/m.23316 type:complete len:94 (-) Transcript_14367:577-858(-)